jgi:serine/threonine-protein kinase RsbW
MRADAPCGLLMARNVQAEAVELNEDSPTIRLELDSRPETLTLVRGALGGMGELLAFDPELLDDLKTAVSEACNNVVMHAYNGGPGPLAVSVYIAPEQVEVVVRDAGVGIPELTSEDDRMQGVGLPVIRALAQEAEFRALPSGGTEVRMSFEGRRAGKQLFEQPGDAAPDDGWAERRFSGDAVVSLSPVGVISGVLGRLARALAARASFSLDRFSDVYLVTDAVAAHVARAASEPRIGFSLSTDTRRLELTIGPFREGASIKLRQHPAERTATSALSLLSDELDIRSDDRGELLHVVMSDERRPRASV